MDNANQILDIALSKQEMAAQTCFPNSLAIQTGQFTPQLTNRANAKLMREANLAVTHEKCRAVLAMSAMENAAILSAMEAYCYKTAPFGELRYRHIADAYAASAALRIARW